KKPGQCQPDQDADPQRLIVGDRHDADAIAAEKRETDLTEVQQTRVPEVQIEPDCEQGVEDRGRTDELSKRNLKYRNEVHGSPDPCSTAEDALGADDQNDDEYQQPADVLEVGVDEERRE